MNSGSSEAFPQNSPKIDLTTFFLSISSAAFFAMGYRPPEGPPAEELGVPNELNLDLARQNIDLLELMREKTKGNLTDEEGLLLERLLYETRMKFIELQKGKK